MARLIIAVHALVVVSLATCGSLAQSNPAIDSPASALRAVIDAIERKDAPALAGLIELPLPVNQHDSSLFAERLMLGSRLYWTLSDRFGPREALRVMRRARLDYLPRVDVQRVEWEPQLLPDPFDPRRRKDVLAGSIGGNRIERVHVVKTQTGFRLYHNDQPAMIALNVEDAPWRNRVVEDVLDGLRSGRIMTMEQVIAALVPRAPAQAEPAKADRTTPAGAVRAALDAIDRGDLETLRDSFEMIGGGGGRRVPAPLRRAGRARTTGRATRARAVRCRSGRADREGRVTASRASGDVRAS